MSKLNTTGFANDIADELEALRNAAAKPQGGLRILQEVELGWIGGGETIPDWNQTPPTP